MCPQGAGAGRPSLFPEIPRMIVGEAKCIESRIAVALRVARRRAEQVAGIRIAAFLCGLAAINQYAFEIAERYVGSRQRRCHLCEKTDGIVIRQAAGEISRQQLQAIVSAHRRGKAPPQNTRLGGQIGIHGLGEADLDLHRMTNWTRGCVALTDRQVDSLLGWIRVGMTVEIR